MILRHVISALAIGVLFSVVDGFMPSVVAFQGLNCRNGVSGNLAVSGLTTLRMADETSSTKKKLFQWEEARKYARSFGFQSQEEWEEYGCPGAYTLPKRPDLVYVEEWEGWEDFLGVIYSFQEGRQRARALNLKSKAEWDALVARGADTWPDGRIPVNPEKVPQYKAEWKGWDDWLGA